MSVEKKFTSPAGDLTLVRPHYKAFRNIAVKVAGLLDVDFEVAMSVPEFEHVLAACVQESAEALSEWLEKATYDEAARLWDAVIAFCEFDGFFAERRKQRSETLLADQELQVKLQAAQFKAMKDSGMLPADFSVEKLMMESGALNLNPTLPSSTSTQADTDGTSEPSNSRTSGGSSGTSPKQRGGGKRSTN